VRVAKSSPTASYIRTFPRPDIFELVGVDVEIEKSLLLVFVRLMFDRLKNECITKEVLM
jgi:hypothetical protein